MRTMRDLAPPLLLALSLAAAGCGVEPRRTLGDQCELNSECQAPLVCRMARCRNECLSTRDCGLGLRCVLAPDGLGVCQLPDETACGDDLDCPESLVCTMEAGCTNACDPGGDDCAAGAACVTADDGTAFCSEPRAAGCVYNSDCVEPMVCRDERCVTECAADQDCPDGLACVAHEACGGAPCACRRRCDPAIPDACPTLGTQCVMALDGTDALPGTCERAPRD